MANDNPIVPRVGAGPDCSQFNDVHRQPRVQWAPTTRTTPAGRQRCETGHARIANGIQRADGHGQPRQMADGNYCDPVHRWDSNGRIRARRLLTGDLWLTGWLGTRAGGLIIPSRVRAERDRSRPLPSWRSTWRDHTERPSHRRSKIRGSTPRFPTILKYHRFHREQRWCGCG